MKRKKIENKISTKFNSNISIGDRIMNKPQKMQIFAFEFSHKVTGKTFFPGDKDINGILQSREQYKDYVRRNPNNGFYTTIGDIEIFDSLEDYKKEKIRRQVL